MARRLFSKAIHAKEERNSPPSADQGLSTAKPRSSHVTWGQCWNLPTSPCPTLSAGVEPKSQGHCWIVPCFSIRSSSQPLASLMPGWGLKNFGVASGFTCRVALYGSTVPSPSLKTGACHLSSASRLSVWVTCTAAISLQFNRRYFSQFWPNRLGPSPATTTRANLATWSP